MPVAVLYLATAVTLLVLSFAWLGTVGGSMFRNTLGDVIAPGIGITPAALFYLLYVAGILYFAAFPGLEAGSWTTALMRGLLLGFFASMTYNLTNLATLRNYTTTLAVADMAWGTIVTGVSAAVGTAVTRDVLGRFG